MRRSIRSLLTGVTALALSAPAASAQIAQFNVGASFSDPFDVYSVNTVGWFYTPSQTFSLTGISTQFAFVDDLSESQVVTVELFGPGAFDDPNVTPTAFASSTFLAGDAETSLGGAAFGGVTLTAGTQYFIGFNGVLDLGLNLTVGPDFLGPVRYGAFYETLVTNPANTPTSELFYPVLQIDGRVVPTSPVPEPATVALFATGLAGVAVVARRRRQR